MDHLNNTPSHIDILNFFTNFMPGLAKKKLIHLPEFKTDNFVICQTHDHSDYVHDKNRVPKKRFPIIYSSDHCGCLIFPAEKTFLAASLMTWKHWKPHYCCYFCTEDFIYFGREYSNQYNNNNENVISKSAVNNEWDTYTRNSTNVPNLKVDDVLDYKDWFTCIKKLKFTDPVFQKTKFLVFVPLLNQCSGWDDSVVQSALLNCISKKDYPKTSDTMKHDSNMLIFGANLGGFCHPIPVKMKPGRCPGKKKT